MQLNHKEHFHCLLIKSDYSGDSITKNISNKIRIISYHKLCVCATSEVVLFLKIQVV